MTEEPTYEMVTIPEGTFTHPDNFHSYTFTPFQMGVTPVTVELWDFVVSLPVIRLTLMPRGHHKNALPVTSVSYNPIQEFIGRYSTYTGINYRLPTQEEWEWACNGTIQTAFHTGQQLSIVNDANFSPASPDRVNIHTGLPYLKEAGNLAEVGYSFGTNVQPPKMYKPNAFGLYDMHGNVWEMTSSIASQCTNKRNFVIKGGSYASIAHACRTYNRALNFIDKNDWNTRLGFRLVCDLAPEYDKILSWLGG